MNDGVEGVRVLTFWGGYAGFAGDISRRASADFSAFLAEVWDWGVRGFLADLGTVNGPKEIQFLIDTITTTVPNTYSFLDLVVLATGRTPDDRLSPCLRASIHVNPTVRKHQCYKPRDPNDCISQ